MDYFAPIEFLGYIADVLFLGAFFLVSQGKISGAGFTFNIMNLIGAVLYLFYAIIKDILPIIVLELVWFVIAGVAIYNLIMIRKKSQSKKADDT